MSLRGSLLVFGCLLCWTGFSCPPLSAQDAVYGQSQGYPAAYGARFPDHYAVPVPSGRAPKPAPLNHGHAGPVAPTYPYGYFGAESHYRWNSHFTVSEEYMFWWPGWRRY